MADDFLDVFNRKKQEFGGYQGYNFDDSKDPDMPLDPPTPWIEEDIEALEGKIKAPLPDEYRQLLAKFGAGMFPELVYVVPIQLRENQERVNFDGFYGLDWKASIWDNIDRYAGRIPGNLVPIGASGFGDHFCIAVRGPERGQIYYWDHEEEGSESDLEDPIWGNGNVTLVAHSLVDFLNRMELYED